MAIENPPITPAVTAQKMLARLGKFPCWVKAMASISTRAQMCENAVSTKALARREPYPPAKSEAPPRKTAVTEYAAGANCDSEVTPDEGNTRQELCRDHRFRVLEFPHRQSLVLSRLWLEKTEAQTASDRRRFLF